VPERELETGPPGVERKDVASHITLQSLARAALLKGQPQFWISGSSGTSWPARDQRLSGHAGDSGSLNETAVEAPQPIQRTPAIAWVPRFGYAGSRASP
jgi:hypothetical protein